MKQASVRRDGTCRTCRGVRPALAVQHRDPFCRAVCARQHYGLVERVRGRQTR